MASINPIECASSIFIDVFWLQKLISRDVFEQGIFFYKEIILVFSSKTIAA